MARIALLALALFQSSNSAGAQTPDLSGKWSGYWVSDKNGHTGPLHGRFRQVDAGTYRVAFRGRFWGVFPFWYSTPMQVSGSADGSMQLTASRRLGPLGLPRPRPSRPRRTSTRYTLRAATPAGSCFRAQHTTYR